MEERLERGGLEPLTVSYTLEAKEISEAVKLVHLRRGMVMRVAQSAALVIILLMYVQAVYVEPAYTTGYVMAAVAAAALTLVWTVPLIQSRGAAKKAAERPYRYEIEFHDLGLLVKESDASASRTVYSETDFYESPALLLLVSGKNSLYCVPKRVLEPEEEQRLVRLLTARCAKAKKI